MTFSDELYPLETYKEISFVVDEDAPNFSELLPCLPNRSFKISREKKALYHAYCVMSGNFSTLLWEKLFSDLKNELGIPASAAKAYLKQVAQNLIDVADGKKQSVLTGPLVRGDLSTIETHLKALDKNFDSYSGIYRAFLTAESHRFHQLRGSTKEPAKEG
jgi:2-dehydropantoate 2-reductase